GVRASELALQLTSAYRQGSRSRLAMLLNQDDPRHLSRRLAYHGYLSRARIAAIEELQETVAALMLTREELDAEARRRGQLLARRSEERRVGKECRSRR